MLLALGSSLPPGYAPRAPIDLVWDGIFLKPRLALSGEHGAHDAQAALKQGNIGFVNGGREITTVEGQFSGIPKCYDPKIHETVTDVVLMDGEEQQDELRDAYAATYNQTIARAHPDAVGKNCVSATN